LEGTGARTTLGQVPEQIWDRCPNNFGTGAPGARTIFETSLNTMEYEIIVESSFSAAHRLRGYKGKCESLHGHNWRVQAVFVKKGLNKIGVVLDFNKAKELLETVLSELDHKDINRIEFFKKYNPTSELIAKFIFDRLKRITKGRTNLKRVSVWETPTSCASYGG